MRARVIAFSLAWLVVVACWQVGQWVVALGFLGVGVVYVVWQFGQAQIVSVRGLRAG